MKNVYKKLVLSSSFLILFFPLQAQNAQAPLEDIINAVKSNNVQDIEKYMDNFVTISINSSQSIYSHNQAQVILHDFFEKNDPKSFLVADSRISGSTPSYVIGTYNSPDGNKYTVYILMKNKNGKYLLQEIRINKE